MEWMGAERRAISLPLAVKWPSGSIVYYRMFELYNG